MLAIASADLPAFRANLSGRRQPVGVGSRAWSRLAVAEADAVLARARVVP